MRLVNPFRTASAPVDDWYLWPQESREGLILASVFAQGIAGDIRDRRGGDVGNAYNRRRNAEKLKARFKAHVQQGFQR